MFDDHNFLNPTSTLQLYRRCICVLIGSREHDGIAGICENNQMELSGPPDASNVALDSFKALCDDVLANSKMYFQPLLDRIERKIEEMKGLRDGVRFSYL